VLGAWLSVLFGRALVGWKIRWLVGSEVECLAGLCETLNNRLACSADTTVAVGPKQERRDSLTQSPQLVHKC